MFRTKIYASPENFTHPPDVMDVTFRRSATDMENVNYFTRAGFSKLKFTQKLVNYGNKIA